MTLSIGFIGAGNINRMHMKNAQALGCTLAAAADPVAASLEECKKQFGIARGFEKWQDLLADKSIDAVVVGTPNKFHAEQAVAALHAGKHVLLEKPMAMNEREADQIVEAARRSGRILQMGMVNRFRNSVKAVKAVIDAGRCGTLYAGQTFWYRRRGIPGFGGWFTTKAMSGGGGLIDIGVHMLDVALYLMGFPKPVAVAGMTYNIWDKLDGYTYTSMWGKPTPGGRKDVDDYALALIRFDQGQTLQLNVSWALNIGPMQPGMGVRLMGDKAGVALDGLDTPSIHGEEAGHLVDSTLHYAKNDAGHDEMQHFLECIEHNREPIATAEQGRTVQRLLDAIYRSGEERREIRLD